MSEDYKQAAEQAEQQADALERENQHLGDEIEGAKKARDDAYADPVIADPKQGFDADDAGDAEQEDATSHAEDVEAAQDQAAAEADEDTSDGADQAA